MTKISISKWRCKAGHNPRYSVYDGQNRLGSIFEARGIFSAVDSNGNLVAASTSLHNAVDSLCPMTGASSS
jgi:hypothetical protein